MIQYIYTLGADLISQECNGKTYTYLYDGHGSVTALSDESGKITDTYSYDAFGNLLKSKGRTDNDYRYCGEQFDSTTGLYYLRARYMDTSTGRFISQDSYAGSTYDPASLHKYLYANSNPVMYSDPSGYMGCPAYKCNIIDISWRATQGNISDIAKLQCRTTVDDIRYYSDPLYMGIYAATVVTIGLILIAALTAAVVVYTSALASVEALIEPLSDGNYNPSDVATRVRQSSIDYSLPRIQTFPSSKTKSKSKGDEDEDDSGWIKYFELDSLGRSRGAMGKITSDMIGVGGKPTCDVLGADSTVHLDRGHLIARNLGGSGYDKRNFTPIYHDINNGSMKSVELKIATQAKLGIDTYVLVIPSYNGNELVPSQIDYYYSSVLGIRHYVFENTP